MIELEAGDLEADDLEALAPRDRLALLSEIVSRSIIEEDLSEVGAMPARGQLQGKALGGLDLIDVSGSNMRAQRTRTHVARAQSPLYLLSVQLAGSTSFRWREQDVTTSPGDIFIVDSRHAYDIDGERPFHQLIVRFPKTWVDARVARPDLVPGALLRDNPMSRLFASYARSGFDSSAELSADAAAMFAAHSVELLALALGERRSDDALPTQAWREALFVRAGRLIALRFAEPDLTPDRIAGALGISARLLQKVFAERGATMMERVWETRVKQAAKLLAMPEASSRSITEVAFACGFKDSAHFTRAFAARIGVTPSQWRQQARVEIERSSD
jgi:AraC family transcriptional regulator, positive regulator of tynA and feaB